MRVEHKRNRRLPYIIEECVEFLYRNDGLEIEGIFRYQDILISIFYNFYECKQIMNFTVTTKTR